MKVSRITANRDAYDIPFLVELTQTPLGVYVQTLDPASWKKTRSKTDFLQLSYDDLLRNDHVTKQAIDPH